MEFTDEMIAKAKEARSIEELMAMAKEASIELSEADAEKYYGFLHMEGELSDDELSQVAGGKGGNNNHDPAPKYQIGQTVKVKSDTKGWVIGRITNISGYRNDAGRLIYRYTVYMASFGRDYRLELEQLEVKVI